MPSLLTIALGVALFSPASTAPTTPTVNKVVQNAAEAKELWQTLLDGFGRIKGEIEIDERLHGHLQGKCSDFVIEGSKYPTTAGDDPRGATRAYGNIASGKCSYMLFVEPTREVEMSVTFEGDHDPSVAQFVYVRSNSDRPKRVWAGKTRTANFELLPGWVG